MFEKLKQRADKLKAETYALYLAARDPRTPWAAKILAACVVAYLLSPIDLIPDFVPVIGYLDDLILVPIGIAVVIRLIPRDVLADCRARAKEVVPEGKPTNWYAAAVVVSIWISGAVLCAVWACRVFGFR